MEDKSPADKALEEMLGAASQESEKKEWTKAFDNSVAMARKEFWKMTQAWPEEYRYAFAMGMLEYHKYLGFLLAYDFATVVREQDYNREEYEQFLFTCLTSDCTALTKVAKKLKKG